MTRAVIFDCFGVMYIPVGEDFYRSHVPDYQKHSEQLRSLSYQADVGNMSQNELVMHIAELMQMSSDKVRAQIVSGLARNQALLTFSQSLRPKYKVGLLSNISAGTMDQFFSLDERRTYFDAVVLSSDVGLVKPDPAIFVLAANRLGCAPNECIMIDNSPINCSGAIQAGMQAVVYATTPQVQNDVRALL
jgi:HAD superfamily hydrolase (TIGR01509 family)